MFYKTYNNTNRPAPHREGRGGTADYKTRRPKEKEMIFGIRAVMEAIEAGKTIDKILLRRDMSSVLAKELLVKLQGTPVPVQKVPVEKLNQFTDKNHQGVIAFLSPVEFQRVEDIVPALYEAGKVPFIVLLDGITDMRNFGAIARTCACAGVDALIIPAHGTVAVNGDAVKTSAGALHTLPLCKVESLTQTLRFLRDSGCSVVAATEHAEQSYTSAPMTDPLVLVMGAEDVGISEEVLRQCTCRVRIPMAGVIESLNVSVAAGVMIYEVIRQRA